MVKRNKIKEEKALGVGRQALRKKHDKKEEILYARGYLISHDEVAGRVTELGWRSRRIGLGKGTFVVYYDERNEICSLDDGANFVFLLGVVLDPTSKTHDKSVIGKRILSLIGEDDKFFDYLEELCGRYIIITGDNEHARLVQDATGMRTCYYGSDFVASHYELLNEYEQHEELPFYGRYKQLTGMKRPFYLPGDFTPYAGVFTLLPNHELDLRTHQIRRFFPRSPVKATSANEVADYFARLIHTEAEVLSQAYHLLVSFTGGNDSRVTLSALRHVKEHVTLFTYDNHEVDNASRGVSNQYDNQMARCLASDYGLRLMTLNLTTCSANVRDRLKKNHYHRHIDGVVPAYLLAFDKYDVPVLHIRSNILETIRSRNYFKVTVCDATAMARMIYGQSGLAEDPTVVAMYEDYCQRNEWDKLFGFDAADLLYWEMRMGIWHAGGILLASDAAIDTYCFFNQRKLLRLGLSTPELFRSTNFMVERTIGVLWPELMFRIPNTNENLLDSRSPLTKWFCRWVDSISVDSSLADFYKTVSDRGVEVGFSKNERNAGDRVSVHIGIRCRQRVAKVVFLVSGVSFWENRNLNGLEYHVRLNGKEIYRDSCDHLRQRPRLFEEDVELFDNHACVQVDLVSTVKCVTGENTFVLRVSEFSGYFTEEKD